MKTKEVNNLPKCVSKFNYNSSYELTTLDVNLFLTKLRDLSQYVIMLNFSPNKFYTDIIDQTIIDNIQTYLSKHKATYLNIESGVSIYDYMYVYITVNEFWWCTDTGWLYQNNNGDYEYFEDVEYELTHDINVAHKQNLDIIRNKKIDKFFKTN